MIFLKLSWLITLLSLLYTIIKSYYAKLRGTSSHRINSKSEQSMQTNAMFINNQPSHE